MVDVNDIRGNVLDLKMVDVRAIQMYYTFCKNGKIRRFVWTPIEALNLHILEVQLTVLKEAICGKSKKTRDYSHKNLEV